MTSEISDWFRTVVEAAHATGRHRRLDTVLGPINILAEPLAEPAPNWPSTALHQGAASSPFATVVITRSRPPAAVDRLLRSPAARHSNYQGHGAFPVRWLPGTHWLARYTHGPYVLRHGRNVIIAGADHTTAQTWTDRVLREVLIHAGRAHGFRLCHGAALAFDKDHGLLLTGESGAGKTDLALKLARALTASVVTVDRGILGHRDGHPAVGTLPFGMNVHHGTLTDLGVVTETLADQYPPVHGKHYLSVADTQGWCRVTVQPWARISGVIAVVRSRDAPTRWRRLKHHEILAVLAAADTGASDPGYQTDWLGLTPVQSPERRTPYGSLDGWLLHYRPQDALPHDWINDLANVAPPAPTPYVCCKKQQQEA
ncbi:hypothetical protein H9Y04_36275 [Streptomyces sp. TRM66268-LWL]|uniref:HPr kinase n=1 Tax=Streptomyces polyasparticus TaxID=2767826 RepID=A0ABR7SSX7_9ACTN|nr:hypothetical protein [Streptomyces polyasparticus]MBC9718004.1 hypothetical protein [Streptomyces polyasparticus]